MFQLLSIAVLVLASLLTALNTHAHSQLIGSSPKADEVVTEKPAAVELTFSVAIQAAMSTIAVTDQNGRRVDKNNISLSPDGKILRVDLQDAPPGLYRVEWRVLSVDDHVIKGDFKFETRLAVAGSPARTGPVQQHDHDAMVHMDHEAGSGVNWPQTLIRSLMYFAILAIPGGFAFTLFVVRPTLSEIVDSTQIGPAAEAHESRFLLTEYLAVALLAAAAVAALVLQTSTVLGAGVFEALEPTGLLRVLSETSFGPAWILQIGSAAAILLVLFLIRRTASEKKSSLLWVGLLLSGLILLAPGFTGHARAAATEYRFAVASDWLHLAAAGVWIGGLIQIAVAVPVLISKLSGNAKFACLSGIISRFNRLAVAATLLIVATGLYNTWIHVESFSALSGTSYGVTLLLKVALTLLMIVAGAVNSYILHPRIKRSIEEMGTPGTASTSDARNLFRSVNLELGLAACVLLLAAILAFLPPARKHRDAVARIAEASTDTVEIVHQGEN